MAQLTDLPDELILQILSYNVPTHLTTRTDFPHFIRSHASSKRLLRLSRDAFFQTFTHSIDLSCMLANFSRHKISTQTSISGILSNKTSFKKQIRRLNLRVHVYYMESVETAIKEVKGVLEGYERLGRLRVGISTGNGRVGGEVERRVREELEGGGVRNWIVEVFVAGERMRE